MHFLERRSINTMVRVSKQLIISKLPGVAVLDIRAEDVENILFAKFKRLVIFVIDAIFPVPELMVDC